MRAMSLKLGYLVACLVMYVFPTGASADPTTFFPSVEISEDDRLSGEYYLLAQNCHFELSQYIPNRKSATKTLITKFDLSYYDTDPPFVNAPYSDAPVSTRHNMVWFAKDVTEVDLESVNAPLRAARLTFPERRNLTSAASIEKSRRLVSLLGRIENGESGQFAAHNHSKTIFLEGSPTLVSVHIPRAFVLPIERGDAQNLIAAINLYRLEHCSAQSSDGE